MPKTDGTARYCERYERFKKVFADTGATAKSPMKYAVALHAAQTDQVAMFGSKFRDHKKKTKQTLAYACLRGVIVIKARENRCKCRIPATSHGIKLLSE